MTIRDGGAVTITRASFSLFWGFLRVDPCVDLVDDGRMNGINLGGMEGGFGGGAVNSNWDRGVGPMAGTDYPLFSTKLIDYYAKKKIAVLRLLFTWERIQSELFGAIPAAGAGYAAYFANFKAVIDYATGKGLQVIIEPWQLSLNGDTGGPMWRGVLVGSPGVDVAAFADFWQRLAGIFKDNPRVIFALVNEPNHMSTMAWWSIAQKCVDAIRGSGASNNIFVPGNGYTAAGTWTQNFYDTAPTPRSNAYGWLNANGVGSPLRDPLGKTFAEVHLYLDADASGSSTDIVSVTIARERLSVVMNEAAAQGYRVFVGEIGTYAGNPIAKKTWADFIKYTKNAGTTLLGWAWWAGGAPQWWDDVGADGGGHFSVTPTKTASVYSGDTINMKMIAKSFAS